MSRPALALCLSLAILSPAISQTIPPAPMPTVTEAAPRVIYSQPAPVYAAPPVVYAQPAPMYAQPPVVYAQPTGAVCPNCGRIHAQGAPAAVNQGGLIPGEINRNPAAFAHARREAAILAQQGDGYPNRRDGGHPLGPGGFGRRGGTGVSMDGRPNHCYDTAPESQIVARAAVRGSWRGRPAYFWSAILR